MQKDFYKSEILDGLKCIKSFWLAYFHPELRHQAESAYHYYDLSKEVEMNAVKLFAPGKKAAYDDIRQGIEITRQLMESDEKVIYEGAFTFENIFIKTDILVKTPDGIEIYEVRNSRKFKAIYQDDLAIQYYVLTNAGYKVSKASIITINKNYKLQESIDYNELFKIKDLTLTVINHQDYIASKIRELFSTLKGKCPEIIIGEHCQVFSECQFNAYCFKHVPEYSVFDLTRLSLRKKYELFHKGIASISQLNTENFPELTDRQQIQIDCHTKKTKYLHKRNVLQFLSLIKYPVYFLDFETFQKPVPPFRNTQPYEQIPFQFSLHKLENNLGTPLHYEFLADENTDGRENLIRAMLAHIGETGTILVYNSQFESSIIRKLSEDFPSYARELMQIHGRIEDLMLPFKNYDYYDDAMEGSYSLKSVLPALIPELSYNRIEIHDGAAASSTYRNFPYMDNAEEKQRLKKALLEYCRMDTYALVEIYRKLVDLTL